MRTRIYRVIDFFYTIVNELNSLRYYLWNRARYHPHALSIQCNLPKLPSGESSNCTLKRFNQEKRVDLSKGETWLWRTHISCPNVSYTSCYQLCVAVSTTVTAMASRHALPSVNSVFNRYESEPNRILIVRKQICSRLEYETGRPTIANSL